MGMWIMHTATSVTYAVLNLGLYLLQTRHQRGYSQISLTLLHVNMQYLPHLQMCVQITSEQVVTSLRPC